VQEDREVGLRHPVRITETNGGLSLQSRKKLELSSTQRVPGAGAVGCRCRCGAGPRRGLAPGDEHPRAPSPSMADAGSHAPSVPSSTYTNVDDHFDADCKCTVVNKEGNICGVSVGKKTSSRKRHLQDQHNMSRKGMVMSIFNYVLSSRILTNSSHE
jgi:hypothetical protein